MRLEQEMGSGCRRQERREVGLNALNPEAGDRPHLHAAAESICARGARR